MAGRQGREELIKKGLLEMMERGKWGPEDRRSGAAIGGPRVQVQGLGPSGASPGAVPCQALPEVQATSAPGTELRVVLCWAVRQAGPPSCFPRAGSVGFRSEFRHDPLPGQVVLTHAALSYPVILGKHRRVLHADPSLSFPVPPAPALVLTPRCR